jgi:hypothetical protein
MYLATDQYSTSFPVVSSPSFTMTTIHEQGSGSCNEDVLLSEGNLCGVFDGATSLEKSYARNGISGGFQAASIAAETFRHHAGPLAQAAEVANHRIRTAQGHDRIPQNQRLRLWSTSLAAIRLHGSSFEYCHTGDCMIMLLHHDGSHSLLSPELDIDSETLALWQQSPDSSRPIHSQLAEQIAKVRLQMNVSYGVLNGEPEAMSFLRHGHHSLAGVADILLFTDGLMLPKADPTGLTDWQSFADIYCRGGLTALRDHVRTVQQTDPACRCYPRFKMHDDIAAIAVTVDGLASPECKLPQSC